MVVNDRSFQPENLDYVNFNYPHLLKMAVKYLDPTGYIPFKYWLSYPVTAIFSVRGCIHNCGTCGGSLSAFNKVCKRTRPSFRSPELVAEDIRTIAEYTGGAHDRAGRPAPGRTGLQRPLPERREKTPHQERDLHRVLQPAAR